jgi:hypothetical protein
VPVKGKRPTSPPRKRSPKEGRRGGSESPRETQHPTGQVEQQEHPVGASAFPHAVRLVRLRDRGIGPDKLATRSCGSQPVPPPAVPTTVANAVVPIGDARSTLAIRRVPPAPVPPGVRTEAVHTSTISFPTPFTHKAYRWLAWDPGEVAEDRLFAGASEVCKGRRQ